MENLRHKKNTCEEKNSFPSKIASEKVFKNMGFTSKSQIFKFNIQQSVLQKRCEMIHLNVPNFLYIIEKSLLGCLK
jgi:hypothetical protein